MQPSSTVSESIKTEGYESYTKVGVIGTADKQFFNEWSKKVCIEVGALLAEKKVVLLCGGMECVGKCTADSFATSANDGKSRNFRIIPMNLNTTVKGVPSEKTNTLGQVILAGKDWEERRVIFGTAAKIYIIVGGGPGSNHEANIAFDNSAVVIPIPSTGGGASGIKFKHDDEQYAQFDTEKAKKRLMKHIDEKAWKTLCEEKEDARKVAEVVARIIDKI